MEEDMLNNFRHAYNGKKLYSQVLFCFLFQWAKIFQTYHKEFHNKSSDKQPILYFSTRRQSQLQNIYCVICNMIITNDNCIDSHII